MGEYRDVPLPQTFDRWSIDQQHGWNLGVDATRAVFADAVADLENSLEAARERGDIEHREAMRAIGALEAERLRRSQLEVEAAACGRLIAELEVIVADHPELARQINVVLREVNRP